MHAPPPEYWWAIGIGTVGFVLLTVAFLVTLVVSQKRFLFQLNETRRSEEKYRSLFDNSLVGMFRLSLGDLTVLDANKTFQAMFQGQAGPGGSPSSIAFDSGIRTRIGESLQSDDLVENEEFNVKRGDGVSFWVSITCRAHRAEGYVEGIAIDITERRLAEDRLRDSHEQLRHLSARLESVREEERIRIARQVHDDLGQVLTAVKMQLTVMADAPVGRTMRKKPGIREKLESLADVIDKAIDLVRNISAELRPLALEELGLKDAIEWEASQIGLRSGITCKVKTAGEIYLGSAEATAVFRIFQEALTNVVRHAFARSVSIRLTAENGALMLEVADDGRGVTEENVRNARALGILGMKERAMFLGGSLSVTANNGKGTLVTLRVPMVQSPEKEG